MSATVDHKCRQHVMVVWRVPVTESDSFTGNTPEPKIQQPEFKHERNHRHRHSALGYQTPAEYAAACRHTHHPVACEIN
jgi:hypothetical protein